MGIGFTSRIMSVFNALRIPNPIADYEREKKEITRRISGGGISREELDELSREADRAMSRIHINMKGMK